MSLDAFTAKMDQGLNHLSIRQELLLPLPLQDTVVRCGKLTGKDWQIVKHTVHCLACNYRSNVIYTMYTHR